MNQSGDLHFGRYNTYMLIAKYNCCCVYIVVSFVSENTEILISE